MCLSLSSLGCLSTRLLSSHTICVALSPGPPAVSGDRVLKCKSLPGSNCHDLSSIANKSFYILKDLKNICKNSGQRKELQWNKYL